MEHFEDYSPQSAKVKSPEESRYLRVMEFC